MSVREILTIPDKRLKTVAAEVTRIDAALQSLIDDMFETMYQAPGIGLAATQVDVHKRLLVLDVSQDQSEPLVLINPVVTEKHGEQVHEEGCLSVPGIYAKVKRAEKIHVQALDREGQPLSFTAEGLLAVCIQHEIDHLNGVVFLDHLSTLKRKMALKKLGVPA